MTTAQPIDKVRRIGVRRIGFKLRDGEGGTHDWCAVVMPYDIDTGEELEMVRSVILKCDIKDPGIMIANVEFIVGHLKDERTNK